MKRDKEISDLAELIADLAHGCVHNLGTDESVRIIRAAAKIAVSAFKRIENEN